MGPITHYVSSSYQGDVDTTSGSIAYTGDFSGRYDITLGIGMACTIVCTTTVATVTTATAHNLLNGANLTMSGCAGTDASHLNITTATPAGITVTSPTTFTYVISGATGSSDSGTYAVNYQLVNVSLNNAVPNASGSLPCAIFQSDVPCTVNGYTAANLGGSMNALLTLGGSITGYSSSTVYNPFSIPATAFSAVWTATILSLKIINTSNLATTATPPGLGAYQAGTLKIRYLQLA